jgi:hypothetical protein
MFRGRALREAPLRWGGPTSWTTAGRSRRRDLFSAQPLAAREHAPPSSDWFELDTIRHTAQAAECTPVTLPEAQTTRGRKTVTRVFPDWR